MITQNKTTIVNIASSFIMQGISFLTIPIFTRIMGTEEFGLFSVYISYIGVLLCIMGLGLKNTIPAAVEQYKNKYSDYYNSIFSICIYFGLISIAFIIAIYLLFQRLFSASPLVVILILLCTLSSSLVDLFVTNNIYRKRPTANLIVSLSISVISTVISILLILLYTPNSASSNRLVGYSSIYIISAIIICIIQFKKSNSIIPQTKYVKFALPIALPMIFNALSQTVLTQSDRIMMRAMGTPESEIGIYSLFYSFANVLYVLFIALNNSFTPYYYDSISCNDTNKTNKSSNRYLELFTVICSGFLLLSREVAHIMADESYMQGLNILPVLVAAMYFIFLAQLPINYEIFKKDTKAIAAFSIACAILNIILNSILIPKRGIYGAAIATAISYFLLFILNYFFAKKNQFKLQAQKLLLSIITISIAAVLFYILKDYWFIRWMIGAIIGIIELLRIKKRNSIF